jgi:hypothetical protein
LDQPSEHRILEALLAIAFGDVPWNRLGSPQPLVSGWSIDSGQPFGDAIRKRHVFDRETIHVESFVVESGFGHRDPFEYEYEYRGTEYEYEYCPDERHRSAAGPAEQT